MNINERRIFKNLSEMYLHRKTTSKMEKEHYFGDLFLQFIKHSLSILDVLDKAYGPTPHQSVSIPLS